MRGIITEYIFLMKHHKSWVSSPCRLCDNAVNVKGIRVLHSLIWHWPCCTVKQMTRSLCEPVLITRTRQNKACSAQLYVHTIVTSVQSRQSFKTSVQALTRHAETLHLQDVKTGQFWYIVQLYGLHFFHNHANTQIGAALTTILHIKPWW